MIVLLFGIVFGVCFTLFWKMKKQQEEELAISGFKFKLKAFLDGITEGYEDNMWPEELTNKDAINNHMKICAELKHNNLGLFVHEWEEKILKLVKMWKKISSDEKDKYYDFERNTVEMYWDDYYNGVTFNLDTDVEAQGISSLLKGEKGEKEIQDEIEDYFFYDSKRVYDVTLIAETGTGKRQMFENDVIMINRTGIFTIEIKNKKYGSKLIINSDGSTNESDGYLTSQMDYHEKLLNIYMYTNFPELRDKLHNLIKSFAVLTDENVEIINETPDRYSVIKKNMINSQIKMSGEPVLNDKEIEKIYQKIKLDAERIRGRKFPFAYFDLDEIKERVSHYKKFEEKYNLFLAENNEMIRKYYEN